MGYIKNKTISSNACKTEQICEDICTYKKCLSNFGKNAFKNTISNFNNSNNVYTNSNLSVKSDDTLKIKINNQDVTNMPSYTNSTDSQLIGYDDTVKFTNFYGNLPVYQQILKSSGTQTPFIPDDAGIGIISKSEENCCVCAPEFIKIFKILQSVTRHTTDAFTQPLSKTQSADDEIHHNKVFCGRHNPLLLFNNNVSNIHRETKKNINVVSVGVQKYLSKESLLCSKCSLALKNDKKPYSTKEQHRIIRNIIINSLLSHKRQVNGKILHNKKENFPKHVLSPQSSTRSKTEESSTDKTYDPYWDKFVNSHLKSKRKVKDVVKNKKWTSSGLIMSNRKVLVGDILDDVNSHKNHNYEKLVNDIKTKDFHKYYMNPCMALTASRKTSPINIHPPISTSTKFSTKHTKLNGEVTNKPPKLGMGDNMKKKKIHLIPKKDINTNDTRLNSPMSVTIPVEKNPQQKKLKPRKDVPKNRKHNANPKTVSDVTDFNIEPRNKSRIKSTPNPSIKKTEILPFRLLRKNKDYKESELNLQNNIVVEKIENENYNLKMNWGNDFRKTRPRSAGRKVESNISPVLTSPLNENKNISINGNQFRKDFRPLERKVNQSNQIQTKPDVKMLRYGKYSTELIDESGIKTVKSSQILDRRKNKKSSKSTKN